MILVSKQSVIQVTLVGIYVKPTLKATPKPTSSYDHNYSGACMPIAIDKDIIEYKGDACVAILTVGEFQELFL